MADKADTSTKPRTRKRVITEEFADDTPAAIPVAPVAEDDDDSPELASLASLFGELGNSEGLKLNVYRLTPGKKDQEFCFTLDPTVDAMDMGDLMGRVQSDYGPGRYKLVARNRQGILPGGVEVVSIAASRRPVAQQQTIVREQSQPIVEAISAAIKPLSDALAVSLQRQQAPAVDPMAQMRQMVEMMSMMRALSPAPVASAGIDPMQQLEMLTKLKALTGDGGGKSMLGELMELWGTIGKPLVDQMIAARGGQMPMPGMGGIPAPLPAPVPARNFPPHGPPIVQVAPGDRDPLQVFVAQIAQRAQSGMNPEAAAVEMVTDLEKAPDAVFEQITDFVEREDAVSLLVAQVPALSTSQGWLHAVRAEFLRLTEDDTPGSPLNDGAPDPDDLHEGEDEA